MTADKFLVYLKVRMRELKSECLKLREARQYTRADQYYARYDELSTVVDELERILRKR